MKESRVVVITGASRGLGRAMAFAFADANYRVAIGYSSRENDARDAENQINGRGGEAKSFQVNVQESTSVNHFINSVQEKFSRIDVLINNAGSVKNKLISKMTDEEWTDVISVNLNGAFYGTRAVIPIMRKQKSGCILNITSFLALRGGRGAANYAAAKAGLISLTKSTAQEEGKNNIRANVVMPGFHVTDMNRDVWEKREDVIRDQHLLPDLPNKDEFSRFMVSLADLKTVSGQIFSYESRLV